MTNFPGQLPSGYFSQEISPTAVTLGHLPPYNFPQIIPPGQLSPEQLPQLKFPRASAPQVFACEQFPLNNFPWTTNPQAIAPLKFSPGQLPQNNFPSRQLLIFVSNRVVLSLDFTLAKQVVQPGILRGIINLSLELWQYSTYFHWCCVTES